MGTWEETVLVAEIGNQSQVPVLSFSATLIAPPLSPLQQWPFMVQMATNVNEQIRFIAAMAGFFRWRRVVAIYEASVYGGYSGMFAALAEQLQNANSEIEHQLVLPPVSSLSDPKTLVREEFTKLMISKQSRVFIVLQSSLSMATHLFREAKKMGLMGKDSAWIVTDSIASLLDSVNTSVISSMDGVIGIKTWFSGGDDESFRSFKLEFKQRFRSEYPEEDNSEPGIHAVRAFDGVTVIKKAMIELDLNGTHLSPSYMLLNNILSSNFKGLSGSIRFNTGQQSDSRIFSVVNVVGKGYKEVGFWSSKFGFSEDLVGEEKEERGERNKFNSSDNNMEAMADLVSWPGNLKRVPKGWAMPTETKKMKIGVPGRTTFDQFVNVKTDPYSGFCIDIFNDILSLVEQKYPLPYEFIPYNFTYDVLVDLVTNKTLDALIGDITILAKRSVHVEFTQPYMESRLTMVVRVKPKGHKEWMFLKPFTYGMWAATVAILAYTGFIVWLLERQSNPEYEGHWRNQLGIAFWFTYSSLFFAQRERVENNFTRVVVVVWLFVVLTLSSSYTANLASMLTVSKLEPYVTDADWLRAHNSTVGCDGDSFVVDYLTGVVGIKKTNIKKVSDESNYPGEFDSGNITAAFLELPYVKAFLLKYCNRYVSIDLPDRFGGFGFAFQKGSPIAADFSEAILTISENGRLKQLETLWFPSIKECSDSETKPTNDSLSFQSFWGLFLVSGVTSTLCYILFSIFQFHRRHRQPYDGDSTINNDDNSVNKKVVKLLRRFRKAKKMMKGRRQDSYIVQKLEGLGASEILEHIENSTAAEVQIEVK